MNWFTPKCPVDAEDKVWIEESMLWLIDEFGAETLRNKELPEKIESLQEIM